MRLPVPPRPVRRPVALMLLAALLVVGLALLPVLVLGAVLLSVVLPGRWRAVRLLGFALAYLLVECGALVALLLLWVAPGIPSADAAGTADLVVARAAIDKTQVPEGGSFRITHAVKNVGAVKATGTESRFYLSTDPQASQAARTASRTDPRSAPQDIRLTGDQSVAAVRPTRTV